MSVVRAETLSYDDGSPELGYTGDSTGYEMALRFSPPDQPFLLEHVLLNIVNYPGSSTTTNAFELRIYADDSGSPGNPLISGLKFANPIPIIGWYTNRWFEIDLTGQHLLIDGGDFYVSVRWLTPVGPSLGIDEVTEQANQRTWVYEEGQWFTVPARYPQFPNRQAMIRAIGIHTPAVPPSDLSILGTWHDRIDLEWSDNSTNENGFRVERSGNAYGPWYQVAALPANSTSFSDQSVSECTQYYYRVFAFTADGVSPPSNVANTTTSCGVAIVTKGSTRIANLTDFDGDQVSVTLKGSGILSVYADDPEGDGRGSIAEIDLSGTDATSSLSIKTRRIADGIVNVGGIHVVGSLKSISAKTANLVAGELDVTGSLGSLTMANLQDCEVSAGGSIGKVGVTTMNGARVFSGYSPGRSSKPMAGGIFQATSIGSVAVKGRKGGSQPAFVNSVIAANSIGKVSIGSVQVDNADQPFGILANDSLASALVKSPSIKWNPAGHFYQGLQDFQMRRDGEVKTAAGTVMVTDEDSQSAIVAGNTMVFPSNSASVAGVKAGDVLASGYGDGFLLKVLSVTTNVDTSIEMTTQSAVVTDAIEKGRIHEQLPIYAKDLVYLANGAQVAAPFAAARAATPSGYAPLAGVTLSKELNHDISGTVLYDQGGIIAQIDDGHANLRAGITVESEIKSFQLQSFSIEGNLNLDADLTLSVSGATQTDAETLLAEYYSTPVVVWVGAFPVVIIPVLDIYVGYEANADAAVSVTGTASGEFKVGAKWERGFGWSNLSDRQIYFGTSLSTASAKGSVTGYLRPELSFLAYGLAGATLSANAYLELDGNIDFLNNQYCWSLDGGLEGDVSATCTFLDGILPSYDASIFSFQQRIAGHCSTITSTTPPPQGVTAVAGNGQVTLNWSVVNGATSYNIYMASQSGLTKQNYTGLPDGMKHTNVPRPFIHTGLTNGKTYYFIVTALGPNGESGESAQVSATPTSGTDTTPPLAGTVRDGTGTDIDSQSSTTTISANWSGFSDPESGINHYDWAIGTTSGGTDVQPFTNVGTASSASNSSLSLANGTTYYVTVRAVNGASLTTSVTSDGVMVNVGPDTSPPLSGTVNDGTGADIDTQSSTTTVSANWSGFSDPESGINHYDWAIGTTPGGTDLQLLTSVGTATSASNPSLGLANGTTYYVTVRAVNGASLTTSVTSDGVTVNQQNPTKWSRTIGDTAADRVNGVATDSQGNIFVTGKVSDPLDAFDGDGFLAKYNSSGQLLWVKTWGNSEVDVSGNCVTVDGSGNIWVGGTILSGGDLTDLDPGLGTDFHYGPAFLSKFDTNGNYLLGRSFESSDGIVDIAIFSDGSLYVVATVDATVDFDWGGASIPSLTPNGQAAVLILKSDLNGVFKWVKYIDSPIPAATWAWPRSVAVDSSGNVFVGGSFADLDVGFGRGQVDFDPGGGQDLRTPQGDGSTGYADGFVVKLTSSGSYVWARTFGAEDGDYVSDVVTDSSGNSYVCGRFVGTVDFNWTSSQDVRTSAVGGDAFVTKITSSGSYGWTATLNLHANALVDETRDMLLRGTTLYLSGWSSLSSPWVKQFDASTGASGQIMSLWQGIENAPVRLGASPDGDFVAGGAFSGSVNFGDATRTSNGQNDGFVVKFGFTGN